MFKNKHGRIFLVFTLVLSLHYVLGVFPFSAPPTAPVPYVSYTQFRSEVEKNTFHSLVQESGSSKIVGQRGNGSSVYTNLPASNDVIELGQKVGLNIEVRDPRAPSLFSSLVGGLYFLLPVLLLIGYMYWMQKRNAEMLMRGPGSISKAQKESAKNFIAPKDNPYRLSDVAGNDEVKAEVVELVKFLKNPEFFDRVGARSPKGVLMSGPPGTGKTLLAKAIAGESGVPFFSASGSDFMEMFVGVGASRVRNLFETAKANAPSIIFIDEIDSVGQSRSQNAYGNEERYQTLNALLVEMDGFTPNSNVVVIAATNRSDVLDEALTRPGRFDREVALALPDFKGRVDILKVHGKNIPIANDVKWSDVAQSTPGFSGAELANLVNEAAVLAAREETVLVRRQHFNEARDKIMMGVRLGSLTNQSERELVAYHEAGHAIVAHFNPHSEPVHKISIMPRGRALGVTVQLPKEDSYHNHGYKKLLDDIAVLMGGRAAEQVALGEQTIGASNDFMRATVLARRMIASWGMDSELGPISVDGERGHDWAQHNVWSEDIKRDVDTRVKNLLKKQYDFAVDVLTTHRSILNAVAQQLMEKETLEGNEFEAIVNTCLEKQKV